MRFAIKNDDEYSADVVNGNTATTFFKILPNTIKQRRYCDWKYRNTATTILWGLPTKMTMKTPPML
jgi:hypothetical protein